MLKLKMMLCVMMLPLVVVSLHIKAVCQSVREATTSGMDVCLPHWRTPLNGIVHPQKRLVTSAKTTGRNRSILMSSADRVAHIDGQLMQCVSNTRASKRYKYLKMSNQTIILRMFAGFSVLTTFSAPPQILAASTVFFCPIQKRRNDG